VIETFVTLPDESNVMFACETGLPELKHARACVRLDPTPLAIAPEEGLCGTLLPVSIGAEGVLGPAAAGASIGPAAWRRASLSEPLWGVLAGTFLATSAGLTGGAAAFAAGADPALLFGPEALAAEAF
jgi:hypothetical protein